MQKIIPFLWFNNQAEEAAKFYTSLFTNSKITNLSNIEEGPAKGSVVVSFQLEGHEFIGLDGGPYFKFTPAISFFVSCKTEKEIDNLWKSLSEKGEILMPLDKYPFSEKFGWVNDRFGVSWQLNYAYNSQKITPFLMFVGKQHGRAKEAMEFYTSLFKNSKIINITPHEKSEGELDGTVKHAKFSLNGQEFMALDSGLDHKFTFSPAISFLINCETQKEIDELWEKLSKNGKKEQCGWVKDKYGVSWQIVPSILDKMLKDKDREKAKRVTQALLQMHKLSIEELKKAYK